ncbi:protein of unknown function [Pseudomonas sp. JV241A]|nr:protein of unknown function [Pseudomonas sp. JV241A]
MFVMSFNIGPMHIAARSIFGSGCWIMMCSKPPEIKYSATPLLLVLSSGDEVEMRSFRFLASANTCLLVISRGTPVSLLIMKLNMNPVPRDPDVSIRIVVVLRMFFLDFVLLTIISFVIYLLFRGV